jgi:hypothetical protein
VDGGQLSDVILATIYSQSVRCDRPIYGGGGNRRVRGKKINVLMCHFMVSREQ